ncbi:hypothetical protein E4K67_22320 [Desulfosporosinus fructosivorans]|uniref:Uncharacterized protein n=1 Tax=Desulfosporosinus fructosivorans TaxID=2018669 RepID=A0A4Z0R2I4_9FIRM|nr:hypothetical protein [Desulfosporosinus fructosivorans]TGE35856.1 hypothetical protein E4K67_22320 [Desulfosporosinus fructosivorans]
MPSDLFTTSYLGSYAGLVAVTFLLVQFFKEPMQKYLGDWWIRLLAVVFALAIQLFTLFVSGNFTVEAIGLAVLNSFLVAITAAGAHNISQPTTQLTVSTLEDYEPIIYKAQVVDVSPPIITPQPTTSTDSDPTAQAAQV